MTDNRPSLTDLHKTVIRKTITSAFHSAKENLSGLVTVLGPIILLPATLQVPAAMPLGALIYLAGTAASYSYNRRHKRLDTQNQTGALLKNDIAEAKLYHAHENALEELAKLSDKDRIKPQSTENLGRLVNLTDADIAPLPTTLQYQIFQAQAQLAASDILRTALRPEKEIKKLPEILTNPKVLIASEVSSFDVAEMKQARDHVFADAQASDVVHALPQNLALVRDLKAELIKKSVENSAMPPKSRKDAAVKLTVSAMAVGGATFLGATPFLTALAGASVAAATMGFPCLKDLVKNMADHMMMKAEPQPNWNFDLKVARKDLAYPQSIKYRLHPMRGAIGTPL